MKLRVPKRVIENKFTLQIVSKATDSLGKPPLLVELDAVRRSTRVS